MAGRRRPRPGDATSVCYSSRYKGCRRDAPEDPAYRKSGNESRYTIYRLPYEPAATGEGALRPTIQIETAVWPLRRPAVERPVISFVTEALRRPPENRKHRLRVDPRDGGG